MKFLIWFGLLVSPLYAQTTSDVPLHIEDVLHASDKETHLGVFHLGDVDLWTSEGSTTEKWLAAHRAKKLTLTISIVEAP